MNDHAVEWSVDRCVRQSAQLVGLAVCGVLAAARVGAAQVAAPEIATVTVPCPALGEERRMHVSLPAGYEESEDRYPVLYCLAGPGGAGLPYAGGLVQYLTRMRMARPTIVIALDDVNGRRDMTPTQTERYGPTSGGADAYIACLRDDIIPWVDEHYRTEPCRIYWGHSITAAFGLYAMLSEPDVFDAAILTSPWLIYDGEEEFLLASAEKFLAERDDQSSYLFMALGREPNLTGQMERLIESLEHAAPAGLEWTLRTWDDVNHRTIVPRGFLEGVTAFFRQVDAVPDTVAEGGTEAIRGYLEDPPRRFGLSPHLTESTVNDMGYRLLHAGRAAAAVKVFRHNVRVHPDSWNAHDSLGDGYRGAGQLELAIASYRRSLELNEGNAHAREAIRSLEAEREETEQGEGD